MSPIASSSQEEMRCYLEQQHQGHQQLITCLDVVGNTVLTGSQDHTLKVSYIFVGIVTVNFNFNEFNECVFC